jgi:hypothetical protein|tara:strand:+ start:5078 stop:5500 length:423 start_codon:yes stop_codon:yes gene_type:complete
MEEDILVLPKYPYSQNSLDQLGSCHDDLRAVFMRAADHIDITIIEGARGETRQNFLFDTDKSELRWPNGKHNKTPSNAVDAAPCPIDWHDRERMTLFAGFILGLAAQMGVQLIWGGDWSRDWQVKDNLFDDLCHFERVND